MFEDARRYLAKVVPWPAYEGAEYVNVHNTFIPSDDPTKPRWGGRASRSLDEAINYVDYSLKQSGTRDIYACMSTQATAKPVTTKTGRTMYRALRSAETAVHLKALFVDCDFKGGEHGYDDEKSALAALAGFLKTTQLPKPSAIVHTGGGVHVYWTMDRALTVEAWLPLAYALAEATKQHNFKCDTQVTVDAARVLRIPETINHKYDPPRPTKLLYALDFDYSVERLEDVLKAYAVATPSVRQADVGLDPVLFPPKAPVENVLGAGVEKEEAPLHLDDVAKECAFVATAISTGGKDYNQAQWNLTSLLVAFTDDPSGDMHRTSNKHPTFKKEEADEMLERKQHERKAKGLGWPSCAAISATGFVACKTCKHFAAGKTPVHPALAAASQKAAADPAGAPLPGTGLAGVTQQVTPFPPGYALTPGGLVGKVLDEGTLIKVADYSIEDPQIHSNSPEQFSFLSQIDRGKKRRIYIDLKSIGAMDMRGILHEQGFLMQSGAKHVNMVSDFMASWIKQLRETRDAVVSSPFGWTQTTGKEPDGFAFNETLWTPSGPKIVSCSDPVLAKAYKPTGTDTAWREAMKIITDQERPALDAILATAFAGPLVRFTGESGALISAKSNASGIGKSSAMIAAMAVWGHPKTSAQTLGTTENSLMGRMGGLKSLPLYWDEVHEVAHLQQFVNITFQTTQGVGKGRMNRNLKLRQPGEWQTLLVLASNIGLVDFMAKRQQTTQAGLYRIFEFEVAPGWGKGQISTSVASRAFDDLRYNHSNIGLEYAKWLGSNYKRCDTEVATELRALEKEYSTKSSERFWMVSIAPLLVGARYANELGFTNINVDALKKFLCVDTLGRLRNDVQEQPDDLTKSENVVSIITSFFTDTRSHMLFTNKIHQGQGKPAKDAIRVATSHCRPEQLRSIYTQYGVEDKMLRVSRTALRRWLEERGHSSYHIMRSMVATYQARHIQGKLASGVPQFQCGQEYLYEIDTSLYDELNFS